jgi:hypothetical protein
MIFAGDPDAICPLCQQPIKKGEITVALTQWGDVYEDQEDDYPLYGSSRAVHLSCLVAGGQDEKR